ncbi:MAG: hypothetical protein WCO05_05015 [Candidatus Moraniibacteriota bacterium]
MDIPPKIRIPLCIEQGSVFNFQIDFDGAGREAKNRYFVVLNNNPKTDTALIMITSTSQVSKKKDFIKRARISEQTIVIVSPSEYCVFKQESAFNCNTVFEVKIDDLIRKIEENGSMNYPKISDNILAKLISGVNASPRVSLAIKKLL